MTCAARPTIIIWPAAIGPRRDTPRPAPVAHPGRPRPRRPLLNALRRTVWPVTPVAAWVRPPADACGSPLSNRSSSPWMGDGGTTAAAVSSTSSSSMPVVGSSTVKTPPHRRRSSLSSPSCSPSLFVFLSLPYTCGPWFLVHHRSSNALLSPSSPRRLLSLVAPSRPSRSLFGIVSH